MRRVSKRKFHQRLGYTAFLFASTLFFLFDLFFRNMPLGSPAPLRSERSSRRPHVRLILCRCDHQQSMLLPTGLPSRRLTSPATDHSEFCLRGVAKSGRLRSAQKYCFPGLFFVFKLPIIKELGGLSAAKPPVQYPVVAVVGLEKTSMGARRKRPARRPRMPRRAPIDAFPSPPEDFF